MKRWGLGTVVIAALAMSGPLVAEGNKLNRPTTKPTETAVAEVSIKAVTMLDTYDLMVRLWGSEVTVPTAEFYLWRASKHDKDHSLVKKGVANKRNVSVPLSLDEARLLMGVLKAGDDFRSVQPKKRPNRIIDFGDYTITIRYRDGVSNTISCNGRVEAGKGIVALINWAAAFVDRHHDWFEFRYVSFGGLASEYSELRVTSDEKMKTAVASLLLVYEIEGKRFDYERKLDSSELGALQEVIKILPEKDEEIKPDMAIPDLGNHVFYLRKGDHAFEVAHSQTREIRVGLKPLISHLSKIKVSLMTVQGDKK